MSQTLTHTMHRSPLQPENNRYGRSNSTVSEIEEDNSSDLPFNDSLVTISEQEKKEEEDTVYVAVGKSPSSIEALSWTLNNFTTPSTILYLIHVFPEIKHLPNPCNFSSKSLMPLFFVFFFILFFRFWIILFQSFFLFCLYGRYIGASCSHPWPTSEVEVLPTMLFLRPQKIYQSLL